MMRLAAAFSLAIAIGIIALTATVGATGSVAVGVLAGILAAGGSGVLLWRRPVVALDPATASRGLKVVSLLAAVLALVQLVRLAVFIVDPSRTEESTVPWSRWEVLHSCVTAYYVAGKAAPDVPNVYDNALYSMPGDPSAPRKPRLLDGFRVDVYEYPPPFLLLPRALFPVAPDFLRFRMIWFALNAAVVLAVMLAVARRFGPAGGTRALLLSSLVWASLPLVNAFQKENVQMMIVALSVLAMLLFEKRRWAWGGFVLAFAIASKLYPGMLVIYLLVRRRWRAVAWTAAFGAAVVLVSLLDTGWTPYAAFLGHLPALLSGEAFPALRNPMAIAINFSLPGLAFKLKLFGVPGMGYAAAQVLGWASTLAALALIVRAARAPRSETTPASGSRSCSSPLCAARSCRSRTRASLRSGSSRSWPRRRPSARVRSPGRSSAGSSSASSFRSTSRSTRGSSRSSSFRPRPFRWGSRSWASAAPGLDLQELPTLETDKRNDQSGGPDGSQLEPFCLVAAATRGSPTHRMIDLNVRERQSQLARS